MSHNKIIKLKYVTYIQHDVTGSVVSVQWCATQVSVQHVV